MAQNRKKQIIVAVNTHDNGLTIYILKNSNQYIAKKLVYYVDKR